MTGRIKRKGKNKAVFAIEDRTSRRSGMGRSSGAGLLANYRLTTSLRDERRNGTIRIEGPTTLGEIGQGIAVLLLTT